MLDRSRLLAALLALVSAGLLAPSCNPPASPTPPAATARYRPIRAEGRWLRDGEGRVVFLRGINYSHLSKTPPFTSWMRAEHFDRIASLGFNCVRLLLIWEALEPTEGTYDESYLRRMEEVVGWCQARGLWVLLDMHQDLWARPFGGDGAPAWMTEDGLVTPNVLLEPWSLTYFTREVMFNFDRFWTEDRYQARFRAAWQTIVRRLGPNPAVIGYDILNEPAPGSYRPDRFEADRLQPFYRKTIASIRAIDPDRPIFVEPALQTSTGLPSFLPPFPEENLVYASHFYDPTIQLGLAYPGRSIAAVGHGRMSVEAGLLQMPLVIGEWGTFLDHPQAVDYCRDQLELQEELMIPGALLWNFDSDPGSSTTLEKDRFDPYDTSGNERPVVRHIDRPYPRRVAGEPIAFGFDIDRGTFFLEWETSSRVAAGATTLVHLPARHFPNGYRIDSTDAAGTWSETFRPSDRTVSIVHDPAASRHRITIRPR